jgi:general secretion pathway protein E
VLAVADPFDTTLRESLEGLIHEPLRTVVAAKCDIVSIIDRVFSFRASVDQDQERLGSSKRTGALVQLVELRSSDALAANSHDEHVIAAVDYLLNYAFEQRATDAVIRFRIDGTLYDIELGTVSRSAPSLRLWRYAPVDHLRPHPSIADGRMRGGIRRTHCEEV